MNTDTFKEVDQSVLDNLTDVTPLLPVRFSTIEEGIEFLERYKAGTNNRDPMFVAGILPYKTDGFKSMMEP